MAEEERIVSRAIHGHVVDDAAGFVAQQRVAHAADGQIRHGSRQQMPGRDHGVGAGQRDLSHVGDVEDPRRLAHRSVLGEDRVVLDRHLEAGEVDQPRAQPLMRRVEGGAPQRGHAAPVRAS